MKRNRRRERRRGEEGMMVGRGRKGGRSSGVGRDQGLADISCQPCRGQRIQDDDLAFGSDWKILSEDDLSNSDDSTSSSEPVALQSEAESPSSTSRQFSRETHTADCAHVIISSHHKTYKIFLFIQSKTPSPLPIHQKPTSTPLSPNLPPYFPIQSLSSP